MNFSVSGLSLVLPLFAKNKGASTVSESDESGRVDLQLEDGHIGHSAFGSHVGPSSAAVGARPDPDVSPHIDDIRIKGIQNDGSQK